MATGVQYFRAIAVVVVALNVERVQLIEALAQVSMFRVVNPHLRLCRHAGS